MLPTWIDDLAVLYWPWTGPDGEIPPVKRHTRQYTRSYQDDKNEPGHDDDTSRAGRDER